jgi:hypothetical protein
MGQPEHLVQCLCLQVRKESREPLDLPAQPDSLDRLVSLDGLVVSEAQVQRVPLRQQDRLDVPDHMESLASLVLLEFRELLGQCCTKDLGQVQLDSLVQPVLRVHLGHSQHPREQLDQLGLQELLAQVCREELVQQVSLETLEILDALERLDKLEWAGHMVLLDSQVQLDLLARMVTQAALEALDSLDRPVTLGQHCC